MTKTNDIFESISFFKLRTKQLKYNYLRSKGGGGTADSSEDGEGLHGDRFVEDDGKENGADLLVLLQTVPRDDVGKTSRLLNPWIATSTFLPVNRRFGC